MKHVLFTLLLVFSLFSGCQQVQQRPHFKPEKELSGRSPTTHSAAKWRNRLQHTRGELGEDLYPIVSANQSHLLFATSRFSKGFDLAFKPLKGYAITFLTNTKFNDIHPSLSPDASKVVFSSDRSGRWNLYLQETRPGGKTKQLIASDTDNLGPKWSPDGSKIAFFKRGIGKNHWEIWLYDVVRKSQSYLTDGLFPSWSPDGKWIAFQKGRQRGEKYYSVWKIKADGSRLIDLMSSWSERWGAIQPSWSADGKWLAFTAVGKSTNTFDNATDRPPESDIYLISEDGAQLIDLTGDRAGGSEWNPFFGTDGRVYFTSDVGGSPRIWSVESIKVKAQASPAKLNPLKGNQVEDFLDSFPSTEPKAKINPSSSGNKA